MQHNNGFIDLVNKLKPLISECDVNHVKNLIESKDNTVIIDVRETDEWDNGFIPTATHISKGIIERDIEKIIPDKDTHLVLYCGGGMRSIIAADMLLKMNYKNVSSLAGGISAWIHAGFQIVDD